MYIEVDEIKRELVLHKEDGTIVSSYSFNASLDDEFTIEDLKRDINDFNETLKTQPEFDNIKDLGRVIKLHKFN